MSADLDSVVNLINERFDDLNARIDDLKIDMVKRHENHELDDKERFDHLQKEIEPLKSMKKSVAGSASIAVVVVQSAAEIIRAFLTK